MQSKHYDAVNSIEFFLNPRLSMENSVRDQITAGLIKGNLVVLRNAFAPRFAARLYRCLNNFKNWKLYEGYEANFHFHHHNIYDDELFPTELANCRELFSSDATKSFVQQISQRTCNGRTSFSASLYLPGDHSLPHNDLVREECEQRQVAFVWHLTKDWRDDWGGAFFWCKSGQWVQPAYNTLLLFNVDYDTKHLVTLVAPHAQGRRLAISGWWYGRTETDLTGSKSDECTRQERLVEVL